MKLKDAIIAAAEEYNDEVKDFSTKPDLDSRAQAILCREFDEIVASGELEKIIAGCYDLQNQTVAVDLTPFILTFRLGMRVQRKLSHPELITSLFDLEVAN